MSKYVDGFVLVVPKNKTKDYKKMALEGKDVWMRLGALEYFECKGDDLNPKAMGPEKALTFPKMTKAKPNETVWFSFVVFKSKKHRDEVNAKVMNEMKKLEAKYKDVAMPFDMKRMAYGGFEAVVEG